VKLRISIGNRKDGKAKAAGREQITGASLDADLLGNAATTGMILSNIESKK
jgi:hypothetical protein